ncbi:hypothetical protein CRYUN_Cryun33cG0013200 [Craigia yunnanensis]
MVVLVLFLFPESCIAKVGNKDCGSTLCGNFNISFPFRLKSQPWECGYHRLELKCENNINRTTLAMTHGKFYVEEINYENYTVRFVDSSLIRDNCSLPLSLSVDEFWTCALPFGPVPNFYRLYIVNCTRATESSLYLDASRCTTNSSSHPPNSYLYLLGSLTKPRDFNPSYTVIADIETNGFINISTGMSTLEIYQFLSMGFELSWRYYNIFYCSKGSISFHRILEVLRDFFLDILNSFVYFFFHRNPVTFGYMSYASNRGIIFSRMLVGISILIALVIYKLRRRHLSSDNAIEEFLQSQNNLMPIRYSYYEIKRMTRGFRKKLGEGGYGSMFKGKLRNNHLVAIKLLDKSKGNGQDFINEVTTIGRIHHVNVAKLIGYYVEGSKQTLVYDFTLNDENLTPKVSDFGLAKSYSVDDSIVSLTVARGTIGYIAPELVCKSIGGISYKADVYSFGMLLMEMVGRRKNLNAFVEQSSQTYLPSWIYNRIDQGEDLELGDVTDNEKRIMPLKPYQLPFEASSEDHADENPIDVATTTLP